MSEVHARRIDALRREMSERGIDFYLIPTQDFHHSEYVAPYFHTREYFCGFTGSNGTLVVGKEEAGLWTDGRYFIQAERELQGSGVKLFRMGEPGVPTITEYLQEQMPEGGVLGFDGNILSVREGEGYARALKKKHVSLRTDHDLAQEIWTDRPALPSHPVFLLGEEYTGESAEHKLSRLREVMAKKDCTGYISSRLDDHMYLLNIRGGDIECNPVALTYLAVTMEKAYLFIQESEVTDELRDYARGLNLELLPYGDFGSFLSRMRWGGRVLYEPQSVSYALGQALLAGLAAEGAEKPKEMVVADYSPIEAFKAVKNETELKNIRECYLEDSAAVCRFIYWLTDRIGKEQISEYSAAMKLDGLRAQISDFVELSFPTISAYGPNAAMMHYEAESEEEAAQLRPEGMLLVDSGGQYLRGTTDVTRTTALGPVTEEMRKHYTLTAVCNLQLQGTVFLHGCSGRNVDIMAREPLWQQGIDFKCGTGHGIGYLLNVHEGPQGIRWKWTADHREVVLEPGMIISDEPGVYREGSHGIRIETILEIVERETNGDGTFLKFEPLTFVPFDRKLIDVRYLTPWTRHLLNEYHQACREKLLPLLPELELQNWLLEQTQEI